MTKPKPQRRNVESDYWRIRALEAEAANINGANLNQFNRIEAINALQQIKTNLEDSFNESSEWILDLCYEGLLISGPNLQQKKIDALDELAKRIQHYCEDCDDDFATVIEEERQRIKGGE